MQRRETFAVLAMLSVSATSVLRGATTYTVTSLGQVSPTAVNDYGQATGTASFGGTVHAFLWTPSTPNGLSGTLDDLGDLPDGLDRSEGTDLNNFGQVVGWGRASTGVRGFLWTPSSMHARTGTMIDLGDLPSGTNDSRASGINSIGQVVGPSSGRAFLWSPTSPNSSIGSLTDLGIASAEASGINDIGQVTGRRTLSVTHAYLWTPFTPNGSAGSAADLGSLTASYDYSAGQHINNSGHVIGEVGSTLGDSAFHWTPLVPNGSTGSMDDLASFGPVGPLSYVAARDIDSAGQIVGHTQFRAVMWTLDKHMVFMDDLLDASAAGWSIDSVFGINDLGQIVGRATFDPDGPGGVAAISRGVLLSPVPEPVCTWLSAVAWVVLLRRARRSEPAPGR